MPDRKINPDARTSREAVEAHVQDKRTADLPSMHDRASRESDRQRSQRRSERAARVVWRRQGVASIDFGVCASWCALVSRGPSASISRFGLRTNGVAPWVFGCARRAGVGCGIARGTTCSWCPRRSRG
jgi:hypothetical protein